VEDHAWVTRIVAGGPGLASYHEDGFTDAHVRVLFSIAGVRYPDDFDMTWIPSRFPSVVWPRTRT
jgi:NADPH-dependent ferric siderophore reductase